MSTLVEERNLKMGISKLPSSSQDYSNYPDACFAYVKPGIEKSDVKGKYFPHHTSDATDGRDSSTVDKSLLIIALAQINSCDLTPTAKERAKKHLVLHAIELNVGDYKAEAIKKGWITTEEGRHIFISENKGSGGNGPQVDKALSTEAKKYKNVDDFIKNNVIEIVLDHSKKYGGFDDTTDPFSYDKPTRTSDKSPIKIKYTVSNKKTTIIDGNTRLRQALVKKDKTIKANVSFWTRQAAEDYFNDANGTSSTNKSLEKGWVTIEGRHVFIDSEGNVHRGKDALIASKEDNKKVDEGRKGNEKALLTIKDKIKSSKTLTKVAEVAKGYETAEEFDDYLGSREAEKDNSIKDLYTEPWSKEDFEAAGIDYTPENIKKFVKLSDPSSGAIYFHGTSEKNRESLLKNGFKPELSDKSTRNGGLGNEEPDAFFVAALDEAHGYGKKVVFVTAKNPKDTGRYENAGDEIAIYTPDKYFIFSPKQLYDAVHMSSKGWVTYQGRHIFIEDTGSSRAVADYSGKIDSMSSWDRVLAYDKIMDDTIEYKGSNAWTPALVNYMYTGYAGINGYLRRDPLMKDISPEYKNTIVGNIRGLDNAIKQSTVKKDFITYRGLNKITEDRLEILKKTKGFQDLGFTSTSLSKEHARDYSRASRGDYMRDKTYKVVVAIKVPKGKNALAIAKVAREGTLDEFEVVLPRGSKFRVNTVHKVSDLEYNIEATLL